jgi:hypothetical protein
LAGHPDHAAVFDPIYNLTIECASAWKTWTLTKTAFIPSRTLPTRFPTVSVWRPLYNHGRFNPTTTAARRRVFVIENDNTGVMLRHAGEAVFTDDDILLATNHFFLLDEPYSCSRITALLGYLMDHGQLLDLDDFWTMMQLVGGYYTIQTFRFVPRDLSLEVAFTDGPLLAPDKTPTSIAWDDLFSAVPPADDDGRQRR